jgi:hypothetical protein
VIVGRNQAQSEFLVAAAADPRAPPLAVLSPANFAGPTALLIGALSEVNVERAGALVARYSRKVPAAPRIRIHVAGESREIALPQ